VPADAWNEHEPADRQDRLRAIQAVVAATIDCRRQVPAP
jgi:hypothetical protein